MDLKKNNQNSVLERETVKCTGAFYSKAKKIFSLTITLVIFFLTFSSVAFASSDYGVIIPPDQNV
jgi:hypothetical protein